MKLYYLTRNYLIDLWQKNMSNRTVDSDSTALKRFIEFCWSDIDVESINRLMINDYRYFLQKRKLSILTINRYLIVLRWFLRYCARNEIKVMDRDLIELAKEPDRDIVYLTEEEIKKLLQAPEFEKEWIKKRRDLLILHLLYWCWLRREELRNLKIEDIDIDRWEIKIFWKWRKIRLWFLTKSTKKCLKKYLKYRTKHKSDKSEYLIQSVSNYSAFEKFRVKSIVDIVKFYTEKAWIKKHVTPHTLRHTFATNLLRKWADISSVQRLLWHKYINTTQIYLHLDAPFLKKQHHLLDD